MHYCYWQWPHWLITDWPFWQLPTAFTSWMISSNVVSAVGLKKTYTNSPALEHTLLYWH